jgi:hypothetical protein
VIEAVGPHRRDGPDCSRCRRSTRPRLQRRVLPARSEMMTTLIAQMSDLLAPISKSTTRAE